MFSELTGAYYYCFQWVPLENSLIYIYIYLYIYIQVARRHRQFRSIINYIIHEKNRKSKSKRILSDVIGI